MPVSAAAEVVARVARVAMWAAASGPVLMAALVYNKDSGSLLLHCHYTTVTGCGALLG